MLGFDTRLKRWTAVIDIPGHGKEFCFSGSGNGLGRCGSEYRGIRYYSMRIYNGGDIGIGGHPSYYVNGLLGFDPNRRKFDILRLVTGDQYHQTEFTLPSGNALFFHSTNVRKRDGSFDKGLNDAEGEVSIW